MRRSSLALIVVLAIIGGAVLIRSAWGPRPEGEEEEKGRPIASIKAPSEKTDVGRVEPKGKEPKTATPAPTTATTTEKVEPPKPKPPVADEVLKQAEALAAARKPVEAIQALSKALLHDPPPASPEPLKARLWALNREHLFSPKPCEPLSLVHTVAARETLSRIARAHHTTYELIMRLNKLDSDLIRVGQRLKVIPGAFDVEVVKSQFRLTVTKDGLWVREFPVGLGKDGSTPVGEFKAGHKLKKPAYFGDGPAVPYGDKQNNPLGTRWITVEGAGAGQYGIHGTWQPDSIGKEVSKGCVRMRNEDVEWLFDLIVPGRSTVVIKP